MKWHYCLNSTLIDYLCNRHCPWSFKYVGKFLKKCCNNLPIYIAKVFGNLQVISGNFWATLQTLKIIKRIWLIFTSIRKCSGTIHKSFDIIFRLSLVCKDFRWTSTNFQILQMTISFEYLCTLCFNFIHVTLFCTGFAETLHSRFPKSEFSIIIIKYVIHVF